MADSGVYYTCFSLKAFIVAIGKATNVAIDHTILERMQRVMPSYASRKSFINQLLDEAISQREALNGKINQDLPE